MSTTTDKENVSGNIVSPKEPAKKAPMTASEEDTSTSPYERRLDELEEIRKQLSSKTGKDHILWILHSERKMLAKCEITEDEYEVEEMSEKERKQALAKLTQKQVDDSFRCMITPISLAELEHKYNDDIMYADSRNDRDSGILMLNTYSSWCMYPVIGKQLTAAVKEVNKAIKAVPSNGSTVVPGVAKQALVSTLAVVFAAHSCHHWRCDTEAPEEVERIAKRVTKVLKDLLWFTDSELGFEDAFSRQALMHRLEFIADDWKGDARSIGYDLECNMNFKTKKNQQGLGRIVDAPVKPPPAKKAKTISSKISADTSNPAATNSLADCIVTGIHDKLSLRVKTFVQLKVTDMGNPKKVDYVVLSGATDMKKVNQLVAFITGCTSSYEYHSQKGTSMKGSRLELKVEGYKPMWIVEKSATKKAAAVGADSLVDKSVKIVQVFQALNCDSDTGLVYDSELAKKIATTSNSLVFVSPEDKRYAIAVQAIAPLKADRTKHFPMPRIVTYREGQRKTGFGLPLQQTKRTMQGDRKDPSFHLFGKSTKSELNKMWLKGWTKAICNEDGSNVLAKDGRYCSRWSGDAAATAGPPDPKNNNSTA